MASELNDRPNLENAAYHYLHTDHLGTPQIATNQDGNITWQAEAEAFGETHLNESNQITMNLRFPGQYYDAETDAHYNYFRDYNPRTGRYQQSDPIGLLDGVNHYGYGYANSLRYDDPTGEVFLLAVWFVGGILLDLTLVQVKKYVCDIPSCQETSIYPVGTVTGDTAYYFGEEVVKSKNLDFSKDENVKGSVHKKSSRFSDLVHKIMWSDSVKKAVLEHK